MDHTYQIIAFLSLCVVCLSEGLSHAILWSKRGTDSFRWNEHVVFVIMRAGIAISAVVQSSVWTIVAWILAYSFLHNGTYYVGRARIDGAYPKGWAGWFAKSKSSSAKLELGPVGRTLLFVAGVAVFVYQFFL